MDKFCVFCGKKPESKNYEHVIPKWLIELTGNPKREALFGFQFNSGPYPQRRSFSFNAFRFPSCTSCNQKYSSLEATTKIIIEKILSSNSLSATDFNVLLDWFDKVRVGLWLGFQYLDKNPADIEPKFYIETRVGINDRMLAIFKSNTEIQGLHYIGCDLPSFTYTPSCFSMHINGSFFLNMSYNDLFSRRIGFPYPVESFAVFYQQQVGRFTWGRNRVMLPLLKKRFTIKGTEIYQPMFPGRISDFKAMMFYDTGYVRENSMEWDKGIGKIFIQADDKFREYPVSPSMEYIPNVSYDPKELLFNIQIQTLEWQQYIDSLAPSLKNLPVKVKRELISQRIWKKQFNKKMIRALLGQVKSFK